MPASESYWRSLPRMHFLFAISSLVLLFSTVWMMAADHQREWRDVQREFFELEEARLRRELDATTPSSYDSEVQELEAKIQNAQEVLDNQKTTIYELTRQRDLAQGVFTRADMKVKQQRAQRDVDRANYDLAVRDAKDEATLFDLKRIFDEAETKTAEFEREVEEAQKSLEKTLLELKKKNEQLDLYQAQKKTLNKEVERVHTALNKVAPESFFSSFKRSFMEYPIIDGFNSHIRIQQDWIPALTINYGGLGEVQRVDRCRTCHLAIDKVGSGNVPTYPKGKFEQPFVTHPNPDLYLTATSPHPIEKFGCTVCHEGQGSGTSFSNASHGPNSPGEHEIWKQKHDFEANHYWEYPMLPERFTEAGCIKCHHNVVELGTNPKFGPTAPKVVQGYNLIREYGCFGCHEINGYDGQKPIGPDLRLEPPLRDLQAGTAEETGLRKVGPALLHLSQKTTNEWVQYWTEAPQRFRPSTRMPSFFKHLGPDGKLKALEGHDDPHGEKMTPVEIASLSAFLMAKSTSVELLKPKEGYQPDAERGKTLFSQRGCLACHSHKEFPGIEADFGPDLSRISEKLRSGEEGFSWLYTWIRDPERHHPRTKMPNLFLETYREGETTIDPAADIAAYLSTREAGAPAAEEFPASKHTPEDLELLADQYLKKVLGSEDLKKFWETRRYPTAAPGKLKGDEVELLSAERTVTDVSDEQLLRYVGRRTINRYGCYACHEIPGFENARPIGTSLQNWGRKEKSKLAFEHIHEFLHHHGEADGSSTAERAEHAYEQQVNGAEISDAEESVSFFYEQVLHGERPGFIWQKLRAPRSYDYKKVETKSSWDDRLRMPKFPFNDQEIEAVATFVLGLVAEPPSERYLYRPSGPAGDRIHGEQLLTKYNCTGCHVIDLPKIKYKIDPTSIESTPIYPEDYESGIELLMKLRPPRQGLSPIAKPAKGDPKTHTLDFHGIVYSYPDPEDPPEDQIYAVDNWETLMVGDKRILPGERLVVPAPDLVGGIQPARGGEFAEWLVGSIVEANPQSNPYLAWQSSPPPLYGEGKKVQTPWLYRFLKNPYQIRHTTLLRMPRFNMSEKEAQTLANYFASVDGADYPYQQVPQQLASYIEQKETEHKDYLKEGWKLFNGPLCNKCHALGGKLPQGGNDPKQDIRGPDLVRVSERLRPEWVQIWTYKPRWIAPYTSMPIVFPKNQSQFPELFGGDGELQLISIRDVLMNYHGLLEREGRYDWPKPVVPDANNPAATEEASK